MCISRNYFKFIFAVAISGLLATSTASATFLLEFCLRWSRILKHARPSSLLLNRSA